MEEAFQAPHCGGSLGSPWEERSPGSVTGLHEFFIRGALVHGDVVEVEVRKYLGPEAAFRLELSDVAILACVQILQFADRYLGTKRVPSDDNTPIYSCKSKVRDKHMNLVDFLASVGHVRRPTSTKSSILRRKAGEKKIRSTLLG